MGEQCDPKLSQQLNEMYESAFKEMISKKSSVVTRFSSIQLEDLLTSSTKNVAHEVVSCMIPKPGESGLLLILEKEIKEIKQMEEYRKSNFTASF